MLKLDSQEIIADADVEKLSRFFMEHKGHIYELIRERLKREPPTLYKYFISDHPSGQRRSQAFLKAFQEALNGKVDVLFEDQRQIGYKRAVEGYELKDVFAYKMAFTEVMWFLINEYNAHQTSGRDSITFDDMKVITHLIGYSNFLLSDSFLKTRDEIIHRRRNQLQELHRYAAKAISIFQEEELRACANQGIFDIFGLDGSFMVPYVRNDDKDGWREGKLIGVQPSPEFVEKTAFKVIHSNTAMAIDVNGDTIPFNEDVKQDSFKVICIPINTSNSDVTGLFFIHDQGRIFNFQRFDKDLLYQFAYLTGAVLSNSLMICELARKKEELHKLTGRLISVQEEEKKRIGADIHDTITQALTAIGYKALLCQALINKDLPRLEEELNRLVNDINGALRKSRSIISELRPKILDDIGIVAGFRRAIASFKEDPGMSVDLNCPEILRVHPDVGIAFYRIFQEALHNIQKHAQASHVVVSLSIDSRNRLCLVINDNGRGFACDSDTQFPRNSGMGLLTMRERAEDLGGQFIIESKIGSGCRIMVTAPL
jgi:signal transduction histidine kinase